MACGNGSDRTQHPVELFGEDWAGWAGGRPPGAQANPSSDQTPADI
jgi:hypothetical protein